MTELLVQFNSVVGDVEGNRKRLQAMLLDAEPFDLALVPELALTGYPPRDLLEAGGFLERCLRELDELARALEGRGAVILGAPAPADRAPGLYNAAWLLEAGAARVVATKQLLPAYDVFDEPRHFVPGQPMAPVEVAGRRVGVTICEDLWLGQEVGEEGRYAAAPASDLAADCDVLVNLSASPYRRGRPAERVEQAAALARRTGVPVAVVNAVGGQDELIFDGHSFWTDGLDHRSLPGFAECVATAAAAAEGADELEQDRQALVLGLRDYVTKCGARRVVLGLSGGVDSALVAALAVDALGADAVLGIAMPSRYSSERSLRDARLLANQLGIELRVIPIEAAHDQLRTLLGGAIDVSGLTDENLQARLRGLMVMAASNAEGRFALATGNKSELGVGYCTLYGDMCGAVAPIGDLFKLDVFELARRDLRIPRSIVEAPPSAELRPDQRDDDSLPPYERLDPLLNALIVERTHPERLVAMGFGADEVAQVVQLVDRSEFKRRQAAPVLRVSAKAFGMGRRQPLAWRRGY
ncbi:MAG: NAD+ synthase [Myxococcota bacterium]|nr:NAD+ synthase [Myxococcota bacterium]